MSHESLILNLFYFDPLLSPSDILDDDSTEFLEALKRQMEGTNILNASPREVFIQCNNRGTYSWVPAYIQFFPQTDASLDT